MSSEKNKVVIVGGGTAGWLTAGVLSSRFASEGVGSVDVTLIESADVSTIGVGEGTWPSMRATLKAMGVSETEFMRECDVSLKQGSRFDHWVNGKSGNYYHPYSLPISYSEFNLAPHWHDVRDQVSFADAVSQQSKLCDHHLAPKQITTPEYAFNVNYGYHLDAGKFALFLRKHCVDKLGVKHVIGHVSRVSNHTNGDIEAVHTDGGDALYASLFIDCTGFAALLIDKHYKVQSNCLRKYLFNDSAMTVQVPYDNDDATINSHTLATAQSAGWIWDIGLPTRRGVGYVYASAYISDEDANEELRRYLEASVGKNKAQELEPRKLSFSPSYRQEFWHKNCVAIGLSAGFVEPLEATAIALVELSAKMLADQFPTNRDAMKITAKRFNEKFAHRWQKITDFLKLHYVINQQDDNAYWQDHRKPESVPLSLQDSLQQWRTLAPWHLDTPFIDEMFPSASYQYVLYGMGFETQKQTSKLRTHDQDLAKAQTLFQENHKRTKQLLSSLPGNREFIDKVNQFGLQKI
jgi:flavin-dependent dehydrogenase